MEKNDFMTGFALLIFGLLVFIRSMGYPFGEIHNPGAGFVPCITSLILIIISLFIMVNAYRRIFKEKRNSPDKTFFSTQEGPKRIVLAFASLLAYRLLFPVLGFIPTNCLFFLFVTRSLGYFSWKVSLVFSFLSTGIAYLLFQVFLKIQMPAAMFTK